MPHNDLFAIGLRSTVFDPRTIVELAKRLDNVPSLSHLFVPEGSQGGFTSLDICSGSLAVSRRLRIGSGVIRILEHDPGLLARQLSTIQMLTNNRFVLGIGTGRAGTDPKLTIRSMLYCLHSTRDSFAAFAKDSPGVRMPETFIATLRKGIAKAVAGHSDGILLNFCPPEHAKGVISSLGASRGRLIVSCYLKIFYSRNERTVNKMLVEEFAHYNENPSYHALFKSVGVAHELEQANQALGSNKIIRPSENLMRISLANPTDAELVAYVTRFREVGVDLPCPYPYFEPGEDEAFKMSKVEEMMRL